MRRIVLVLFLLFLFLDIVALSYCWSFSNRLQRIVHLHRENPTLLQAKETDGDADTNNNRNDDAIRRMGVTLGSMTPEEEEDEDSLEYKFRQQQNERERKIKAVMRQQDEEWKENLRKEKWGEYAKAKTTQELLEKEQEERNRIAKGKKAE